jgi:predicted PurR-regulated permease PerM
MSDRPPSWQMPAWLREMGSAGWYVLGAGAAFVVLGLIFSALASITVPLVFAAIIGAVFSPWVDWLIRHKFKRALAALAVLFLLVVVGAGLGFLVVYGVYNQWPEIKSQAQAGIEKISKEVDQNTTEEQAAQTTDQVQNGAESAAKGLAGMVPQVIKGFAGLVFALFIMVNIMFFMLKDGGPIGDWIAKHAGGIPGGQRLSLFNAVVVGLAAVLLGVPLALTIALVTFAFAFIPYLGAVIAGAFAVIMALSTSPTAALIMLLVVIVANGGLQTVVNQFAMKQALALHPLVSLLVTLLGGVIAGAFGAFLAAPVTAILINATNEYRQAGFFSDDGLPVAAAEPPVDGAEPLPVRLPDEQDRSMPPEPA